MTLPAQNDLVWTGAYTSDGGGRADGIGTLAAHKDGSLEWLGTAVTADSPSFLAVDPTLPVVHAVAEQRRWSGRSAAPGTLDWNYVPGTGPVADHQVALPFGSGPRHLVQHHNGNVFVVSEYSVEVLVVRPEAGTFELIFRGPATSGGTELIPVQDMVPAG